MKIGLVSLGCPKNLVDSEVMLGLAREAGHELTPDASAADVIVVNTCAFIGTAKQESVNAILEMAQHRAAGACRRLVVTGCLAERYRDELRAEIPEIDVVLGTGDVPAIVGALDPAAVGAAGAPQALPHAPVQAGVPANGAVIAPSPETRIEPSPAPLPLFERSGDGGMIHARRSGRASAIAIRERRTTQPLPTYLYDAETPRALTTPSHYAYVKIAEGCDYACSFCIIPALRGHYRSRQADSVVAEARHLAAQGVRELILVSQDTSFYGVDRGERGALALLLRQLESVEGLDWIRLMYLYPTTITDDVLDVMAASSRVVRYIDLPLQHSAAPVLRRMRRPGNRAGYERLIRRIRSRVPGVTLRTTLIVGFPGERADDFDDVCDFVRTVEFDHLGVFRYSHEEDTPAFDLPNDVPEAEKRRRERVLMRVQRRIVTRRHRALIGRTVPVMVDGPSPEHDLVWRGRLAGHAPDIDPVVYLSDWSPELAPPGSVVSARIVGARGYDLVARPVG